MLVNHKVKIQWQFIVLFSSIAIGLSYPIQMGYLDRIFNSITKDTFLSESSYLMAGSSTMIAALIVMTLHDKLSNRITIFGDTKVKNILILSLPIMAFSIIGLNNSFGMDKSLYGFSFALTNTLYAFAEEFGWRRYLQNALEGLNKNLKHLLIGTIWWVWHFRFNTEFDIFIFPLICIGSGFLLGKLADDSKSILPVVSMHTLIILITNKGVFGNTEVITIAIVILGWVLIEKIWKKRKA